MHHGQRSVYVRMLIEISPGYAVKPLYFPFVLNYFTRKNFYKRRFACAVKPYYSAVIAAGNGNKDGYSIRAAALDLAKRTERRKILMVLSDGLPPETARFALSKRDLASYTCDKFFISKILMVAPLLGLDARLRYYLFAVR